MPANSSRGAACLWDSYERVLSTIIALIGVEKTAEMLRRHADAIEEARDRIEGARKRDMPLMWWKGQA